MPADLTRRAAFGVLGATGAVGVGMLTASAPAGAALQRTPRTATVQAWAQVRKTPYFIGHRGSGDVFPEHSLEAYEGALAWGATCIEVSVGMTSDGVLVCMHDPTYDRTTSAQGRLAEQPSSILRSTVLDLPQLGPAWAAEPRVRVPTLSRVLQAVGGRAVLALEAKDDAAYPAMMDLVGALGLTDSVIAKMEFKNTTRIAVAKNDGFPVFSYIGSAADLTPANIAAAAAALDRSRDCLVIPAYGATPTDRVADALVSAAVRTRIPTWVFPVHRRVDVQHFLALGVSGFVTSSYRYCSTTQPTATRDTWGSGAIAPGEMTRDPGSAASAPTWSPATGSLTLGVQGQQHFLTLGHFSPLAAAAGSYTLDCEVRWDRLPAAAGENISLVFGQSDDAYYEHRAGAGSGYHAILRADGRLGLYQHQDSQVDGTALGEVRTAPPLAGQWIPVRLAVTPQDITVARVDVPGATIHSTDRTTRGGYLHLGRSSLDGAASFRNLSVS